VVASAGSRRVAQVSIEHPAATRVLARPGLAVVPIALALDGCLGDGVDAMARDGRVEQLAGRLRSRTAPSRRVNDAVAGDRERGGFAVLP
jgi:hypothetical protein